MIIGLDANRHSSRTLNHAETRSNGVRRTHNNSSMPPTQADGIRVTMCNRYQRVQATCMINQHAQSEMTLQCATLHGHAHGVSPRKVENPMLAAILAFSLKVTAGHSRVLSSSITMAPLLLQLQTSTVCEANKVQTRRRSTATRHRALAVLLPHLIGG